MNKTKSQKSRDTVPLSTQKLNFVPALGIFTDINRTGLAFQKTVIYRHTGLSHRYHEEYQCAKNVFSKKFLSVD